ncbi:MAG: hypothetical protein ACE15C_16935 [Phycisphaerae bacterium]
MATNRRSANRAARAAIPILLVLGLQAAAPAGWRDYSDKDFSVRLPPAFLRFTEVSTVGGETVANRYSSAINPASLGWNEVPSKYGVVVAPYYSQIFFGEGQQLYLIGESATWDTKLWGAVQPTLSQIRTNGARDSNGMTFDYSVDTAQVQWGKRFGDFAFGGMFNYAHATIDQDGFRRTQFGQRQALTSVDVDSNADSYRWRVGGLYQPIEKLLVGMIFEYGFQPFQSETRTVTRLPIPGVPPIPGTMRQTGVQQQFVFRPGVSYEYAPMSTVYTDYQYGNFTSPRDELNDNRFTIGVEHRLFEWMLARFSPSIDDRGNVGLSAGMTFFLGESVTLDLGYQYNMLPEIQPEFGRANTIQACLSVRF